MSAAGSVHVLPAARLVVSLLLSLLLTIAGILVPAVSG
jgi:hypothetical protein